ncbi:MAG: Gfo/Idh/MocA family oxidoreductase [Chloroflexota bacterium]|nr:Gfo/Idh/MocA family oxidoreductase [Chloroflexota bacterium]
MAFGWGIISTGLHPENKIAPAINAAEGAELVAVYSRDQGRAEAFAQRHGASAAYSSLDSLLNDSRVDGVFISSPNSLHAGQAVQAARAGKHVLSEKPMTTTLRDALDMVRACRDRGVKLGVGFELRHNPGHILARDLVRDGSLGRITLAQGQWGFGARGQEVFPPREGLRQWWDDPDAMGGASTMMGTGVHVMDLLRFVMGEEIVEVAAITDGQTEARPLEQIAVLSLRFGSGALGTLVCGRLLPDTRNDLAIYGINGRFTSRETVWEARKGDIEIISDTVNRKESYPEDYLANFVAQTEDFQQAVSEDREPAATGVDGLRVVEVTLAAIESARTGRTVKINPARI